METTQQKRVYETRRGKRVAVAFGERKRQNRHEEQRRRGRFARAAHHERLVESVEHLSLFLSLLSLSDVFFFFWIQKREQTYV